MASSPEPPLLLPFPPSEHDCVLFSSSVCESLPLAAAAAADFELLLKRPDAIAATPALPLAAVAFITLEKRLRRSFSGFLARSPWRKRPFAKSPADSTSSIDLAPFEAVAAGVATGGLMGVGGVVGQRQQQW